MFSASQLVNVVSTPTASETDSVVIEAMSGMQISRVIVQQNLRVIVQQDTRVIAQVVDLIENASKADSHRHIVRLTSSFDKLRMMRSAIDRRGGCAPFDTR